MSSTHISPATGAAEKGATPRIGCQLNAWQRELDFRSPGWDKLDAALGYLREAGYEGAEVPGWSVPDLAEPQRLRDLFDRHGVALVSLHAGGPFFSDAAYRDQTLPRVLPTAECAAAAGAVALVISNGTMKGKVDGFGQPAGREGEAWRAQVRNVADLARRLRDLGLRAHFHNHDAQFEHDAWEMESLLAADPETVELCIDVGHASQTMPRDRLLAWLGQHWQRVGSLHYKDVRGPLGGPVVEALGDGDVDFAAVSRLALERRFDGWIVAELDTGRRHGEAPVRSSTEDARISSTLIRRTLSD